DALLDTWLTLGVEAVPDTIAAGGSSEIVATLNRDNNGDPAPAAAVEGMPVEFSSFPGTIEGSPAFLDEGGAASATLTTTRAEHGQATVKATVGLQSVG